MAIARSSDTSNMPHTITFEMQYSPSDADIYFIYKPSANSSWSLGNVEKSTLDSRTPFVVSDADNLHCALSKTSSASYFHIVFYHRCETGNWLCSSSSYNNTYRVVAIRSAWSSPGIWEREYCNGSSDYTIIPPPPSFENGGVWREWRNIYPVVYRRGANLSTPWWLGVPWVYNDTSTLKDLYWTVSECALNNDNELSRRETLKKVSSYTEIYGVDGRKVKGITRKGVWFIKEGDDVRKVIVR